MLEQVVRMTETTSAAARVCGDPRFPAYVSRSVSRGWRLRMAGVIGCFLLSRIRCFTGSHFAAISKGWTVKVLEFINSGPPALLNNPCCCRRVVSFSFLKHAMEVHYG